MSFLKYFGYSNKPSRNEDNAGVQPLQFVVPLEPSAAESNDASFTIPRNAWGKDANNNSSTTILGDWGLKLQYLNNSEQCLVCCINDDETPLALLLPNPKVPAAPVTTTGLQVCCFQQPHPSAQVIGSMRNHDFYEFATIGAMRTDQPESMQTITMNIINNNNNNAKQCLVLQSGDKNPWVYTSDRFIYLNDNDKTTKCARISKQSASQSWKIKATCGKAVVDPFLLILHTICANRLLHLRHEQRDRSVATTGSVTPTVRRDQHNRSTIGTGSGIVGDETGAAPPESPAPPPLGTPDYDIDAAVWRRPEGNFVKYNCPLCGKKSVFINVERYESLDTRLGVVELKDDGRLYHRDERPIPSRMTAKGKWDHSKRDDMRAHHEKCHSDYAMVPAYAPQRVRTQGSQTPAAVKKRKREHEKAVRTARADRFKNGTQTAEDISFRQKEKVRVQEARKPKKTGDA